MFGAHGEDFYGLIGRIALAAALLEDRLHVLYGALANVGQETKSGEPSIESRAALPRTR